MSANAINTENGQSLNELAQENRALIVLIDQMKKEKSEDGRTMAQLQSDCAYYEKAVMALSRSKLTAEELAQWLTEESQNGLTFDEVMAELLRPTPQSK